MRHGFGRDERNDASYSVLGNFCSLKVFSFFSVLFCNIDLYLPFSLSALVSITLASAKNFFFSVPLFVGRGL